jgi:carbamoyltransferase
MRKRMSESLKRREWFRPLGAVIRRERFGALFGGQPPSPYMLFNYDLPEGVFPEARHADGSSRLQTLDQPEHPRLHDLLAQFEELTGTAGLINTSLNGPGVAIAHSTADMLHDFVNSDVNLFVSGDLMSYGFGAP